MNKIVDFCYAAFYQNKSDLSRRQKTVAVSLIIGIIGMFTIIYTQVA